MIKTVVSVYDTVAKIYGPPLGFLNAGEACRWFADLVNGADGNNVAKHPKDFILYDVGSFDDLSGVLVAKAPMGRLGLASDYVEEKVK